MKFKFTEDDYKEMEKENINYRIPQVLLVKIIEELGLLDERMLGSCDNLLDKYKKLLKTAKKQNEFIKKLLSEEYKNKFSKEFSDVIFGMMRQSTIEMEDQIDPIDTKIDDCFKDYKTNDAHLKDLISKLQTLEKETNK